VYGINLF